MIAFISDIHANVPALDAVLADIEKLGGVKAIYCLGDVVGYGPRPVECFLKTANVAKLILMGNHEHAVNYGAYGFSSIARNAIEWTQTKVEAYSKKNADNNILETLKNLPIRYEFDDVLLVHGSPRDPVMEYVLESDTWEGSDPRKIDEIFAAFKRLCFVGHTHRPGVFTEDYCFLASQELESGFDVSDGAKYLINVGSVGQPRDRDARACYTIFTGDAVHWRRVPYDVEETIKQIEKIPELGEKLGTRLRRGE